MEKEKLKEWASMDFSDKIKYNGYNGFCNGRLFKDDNAFMTEDKARLKKRLIKEKLLRDSKKAKLNNDKNGGIKNG